MAILSFHVVCRQQLAKAMKCRFCRILLFLSLRMSAPLVMFSMCRSGRFSRQSRRNWVSRLSWLYGSRRASWWSRGCRRHWPERLTRRNWPQRFHWSCRRPWISRSDRSSWLTRTYGISRRSWIYRVDWTAGKLRTTGRDWQPWPTRIVRSYRYQCNFTFIYLITCSL